VFYNNPDGYPPIINSARLLARAGLNVDLLCREYGPRWKVDYPAAVSVRRIPRGHAHSWTEYLNFIAQVVHSASQSTALYIGHDMHALLPARILATRYHRPLVYHCHDFADARLQLDWGGRLVRAFQYRFARTADLVIVPDAERGRIIARALQLRKPPLVVANAPLRRTQNREETGSGVLQTALAQRGYSFERVVFRQGRIGRGHAIEATLRSLPTWARREWGFVIMGPGDETYSEYLRALARSLGVADKFVILPPVSYDEVVHFTAGADVGHALYEPIHLNNVHITTASNKIMEYMAAGLPLLVSDRPGLVTLIDEYGCGIAAREDSSAGIADAVNRLLGDSDRARRMGMAAAQAFDQFYCYEHQFAPALAAISRLIKRNVRSRDCVNPE